MTKQPRLSEDELKAVAKKVQKLLAKAHCEGVTEEEATAFADKAYSMLEKYSMNLSDIEIKSAEMKEEQIELSFRRPPAWIWDLASSVADNSYCTVIRGWNDGKYVNNKWKKPVLNKVMFLGATTDVEIATYVFSYLMKTIRNMGVEYTAKYKSQYKLSELQNVSYSYCHGMVDSIGARLYNLKREREQDKPVQTADGSDLALVKTDALEIFKNKQYPKLKKAHTTRNTSDGGAYGDGRADGDNVPLNHAINSNGKTQGQLGN